MTIQEITGQFPDAKYMLGGKKGVLQSAHTRITRSFCPNLSEPQPFCTVLSLHRSTLSFPLLRIPIYMPYRGNNQSSSGPRTRPSRAWQARSLLSLQTLPPWSGLSIYRAPIRLSSLSALVRKLLMEARMMLCFQGHRRRASWLETDGSAAGFLLPRDDPRLSRPIASAVVVKKWPKTLKEPVCSQPVRSTISISLA